MIEQHLQFGAWRPAIRQIPYWGPKHRKHQDRWLLLTARDVEFDLEVFGMDKDGNVTLWDTILAKPYAELWSVLSCLRLHRNKWWMIGWRMRHVIAMAKMLEALGEGLIRLPVSEGEDGSLKRGGKISISPNCVEVDFLAGRNKIKLLDFDNLGVLPGDFGLMLNELRPEDTLRALRDYIAMCDMTGMSASRSTAAQVGWAHFAANCNAKGVASNLDDDARAMERRSYFGGRCETYFLGDVKGTVHSLDVKSCYASICQNWWVPTYLVREYPGGIPVDEVACRGDNHWIADVIIRTPSPDYPVDFGGQTLYPIGQFRTTLAWPELWHALHFGRVVAIVRAAEYKTAKLFAYYAEWFFKAKETLPEMGFGHMLGALKATFNASLGYSARRKYEWIPWPNDLPHKWAIGITPAPDKSSLAVPCQILNGVGEWLRIGGEPRDAMPFLHATICSYARCKLLEIFDAAGRGEVLYCDTDGVLVTDEGLRKLQGSHLMSGNEPGQLVVRFPAGQCRIQGQKNYRLGENVVHSGVVMTRQNRVLNKEVLTCATGRMNADGKVEPFTFRCEDEGGEMARWVNEIL